MDFVDLIKKRYFTTDYRHIPVEDEKIMKILEAGRLAPIVNSFQSVHFIIMKDKEGLEKVYSIYDHDWIRTAPVIIVICDDENNALKHKDSTSYGPLNAAIAIDHMTLSATGLKLGTFWVNDFDKVKAKKLFQTPRDIIPYFLLSVGYPGDIPDFSSLNIHKDF